MSKIDQLSTFERKMQNLDFKTKFETGYRNFLLSELLIAMIENDDISIEQLVKEVNISPSFIQDICSGKQKDLKISVFVELTKVCGYSLILEKGKERISLV